MQIGLLKEIRDSEHRVLLVPDAVRELVDLGNTTYIENGAGVESGYQDKDYEGAGATILPTSEKIYKEVDLVLKIQTPLPIEYELLNDNHICFSYQFPQNNNERIQALKKSGAIYLSGELIPNIHDAISEITGILAINQATKYLEWDFGGKGILFSGSSGAAGAKVSILGNNTVALHAAKHALSRGATVNLIGENYEKLEHFHKDHTSEDLRIFEYDRGLVNTLLLETDVLIVAGHDFGQDSKIFINADDLKLLQKGSVVINLTVNQSEVLEISRETTPGEPTYIQDDAVYFGMPNLSSAVSKTASESLSNAILPYIKQLSQMGFHETIATNPDIRNSLILYKGKIVSPLLVTQDNYKSYDILELIESNI